MKKFFLLIISTFLFVQLACLSVQAQKTKTTKSNNTKQKAKKQKAKKTTTTEDYDLNTFVADADVLTAEQIAKQYLPSIVLIVCDDGKGNTSLGSGFFVGQGMILTNYHVIKGMVRGKVTGKASFKMYSNNSLILYPREWWIEKILQKDVKNDLALLKLKDLGSFENPILSLSDSNKVNIGEKIYVLSNPQGLTGTISQGIVSSEIRKTGDLELLQIDAPISQGSSGGAVLNAQGKVVGIATASLSNGQNLNFAVPSSRIGAFFNQYNSRLNMPYSLPYYPSANIANAWLIDTPKSFGGGIGSGNGRGDGRTGAGSGDGSGNASPDPLQTKTQDDKKKKYIDPSLVVIDSPEPATKPTKPTKAPREWDLYYDFDAEPPKPTPTATPIIIAREPKPTGATEVIKILSKPRANYTNAARQNQVQGTITLRVTFLANGKIGNISVVSGLPNGLTKQAIAAARNIRFSPQLKNGVAQTVIKQVQYNFTLY